MKKTNIFLAIVLFLMTVGINSVWAVNHGSLNVTDAALYPLRDGEAPTAAVEGLTVDFKVVTVGSTTWAWTNLSEYVISGAGWGSQLRWWQPGKVENNLESRVSGTQQTYGKTTNAPATNPVIITIFQAVEGAGSPGFTETDDFTYDYTAKNSAITGDVTAPVLSDPVTVSQTATSLELSLSATDANDYFYYISDAANNFETVSFLNNITLSLAAGQAYNFSIVAIDFSGNTSTEKTVRVEAQEVTNIVEGTAQAVKFKLDSRSLDELVIYVENEHFLFADASVKLEINGQAVPGEKKPVPAIDQTAGTHAYRIVYPKQDIQGWAEDAILSINFPYIQCPVLDWATYVLVNKTITEGDNEGKPILHKIGTGTDITFPTVIAKVDITPKTATITEGGKVELTATAKTVLGDPVDGTSFTWTVNDTENAAVSPTGEFTSAVVGSYTVTATVTDTEISNSATIEVETLSLASAYCDASIGTGDALSKISFSTRRDGRVVIEIAPNDPEAEDIAAETFTAFRNFGWGDAVIEQITVNGNANTGNKYFTRTTNASNNNNHNATRTKIFLIPAEGMLHIGDIIKVNNMILEYETPFNQNAYPNLTFTFTFGSYCGEQETLAVVSSVTTDVIGEREASATVTATAGTFDVSQVNFTEDSAKVPAQSFAVTENNTYTLSGLTANTDYSFTVTVIDVDGNSSEAFATKWAFRTAQGTAIASVKTVAISVYPTVATDVLYVEGLTTASVIKIMHITGQSVSTQVSKREINVSDLVPGVYFVSVEGKAVKFIKK
ncbi:MAG: hypothetical protein EZS26_001577 [Candidatus Ordinivivax streblomastigis]|uniref:T9SS C-terminal target domain-containing protein n=1 Tax=Candidatus Ordinivivax streblomastigis TaxID=2540710 RepID=A0A5M8P1A6_9BACT|nr:MAG: hypothetical protein EZS26_001577 [Candidatus Ordinivivax streblomastigis]